MIAILIGVLLSFASIASAAGYLWAQDAGDRPAQARDLPSIWPSKNGQVPRAVAMPAGEMVAALPPESSAHVLCQALSRQRWEAVLGSPTLREALDGSCHVVTGSLEVFLRLDGTPAPLQNPDPVTVDGHKGEIESVSPQVNSRLNLRLVDAEPSAQVKPFLQIAVSGSAKQPLDELTKSIATAIVHATMTPGPALPTTSKDGTIPGQRMEPVPQHGIVDAPWPMISWQLCTALTGELGGSGKPRMDGQCTVRGVKAVFSEGTSPRVYPDTLAGRPALVTGDLVAVKLTDDSTQELTLTGDTNLRRLAEAVLPRLLGR